MGLGLPEDLAGGTACRKGFQHEPDPGILGTGVQLSVRKGACASFSKLDIAVRIQSASLPESAYSRSPGVHIIAPFQQDGSGAGKRQHIGGKETCRTAADDHRGLHLAGVCRNMVLVGSIGQHVLVGFACCQQSGLLMGVDQQGGGEMNCLLFPGIH